MREKKNIKKTCAKTGTLLALCLMMSLCSNVYAASPTVSYNFTINTKNDTGTAYSTEALKTGAKDYATIKLTKLSNASYGAWMRMDKGSANNRVVATSEQHVLSVKTINSYYLSGRKSIGSTYVVVGRLAPGSPNVTVSGNATP